LANSKAIKEFFEVVLKGESKTYNDHNWYVCKGSTKKCLRGYIEGRGKPQYPNLNKKLSDYTIQEVVNFQKKARSGNGQLYATGRYQIIPNTLLGLIKDTSMNVSEKYNEVNQDKLAFQLLVNNSAVNSYMYGKNEDNKKNLELASLGVAKIWSSVGVPYALQGRDQWVQKNQSYYAGGGDKASEKTEDVQIALKKLRKNINNTEEKPNDSPSAKSISLKTIIIGIILTVASFYVYKNRSYLT
jgi:hypothetical protein